ncbi:ras-related protein Rab-21 [Ditylenchus destructor]|uniref:Ras-related protein Rab-21 n=1 Tax=Ditylenchus destructor TaxID=166010 RepID=A0AAD4QX32_9BILA|nr:ras-related protein Rab-21 [Ditylenchus destructor]
MLFRSTAVENLSFISYFDLLGNDELANVLERLPVQDRMQAELINKRWFNVARGKSWVNFNFLMSKDFEWVRKKLHNTDWTWIDATSFYQFKNMLKQLLTRCGPYVRNVDVTESSWLSRSLCDVLFMLSNVEQIKLCQLHIKNDRLPGYRRCLSDLRTLIADDFVGYAKTVGAQFQECSAKENIGMNPLIEELTRAIVEKKKEEIVESVERESTLRRHGSRRSLRIVDDSELRPPPKKGCC